MKHIASFTCRNYNTNVEDIAFCSLLTLPNLENVFYVRLIADIRKSCL